MSMMHSILREKVFRIIFEENIKKGQPWNRVKIPNPQELNEALNYLSYDKFFKDFFKGEKRFLKKEEGK